MWPSGSGEAGRSHSPGPVDPVEQLVEPADEADAVRDSPDREQGPRDVRRRSLAGVVADRKPLALRGEDDLRRDDEARQAERVHLRARDGRAARLGRAEDLVDRHTERRGPHAVEALRELARGAARSVRLPRARVVDHFPCIEVARDLDGGAE